MWVKLFEESQREMKYCAKLAGREFNLFSCDRGFGAHFFGFNVDIIKFHEVVFSEMKVFNVSK